MAESQARLYTLQHLAKALETDHRSIRALFRHGGTQTNFLRSIAALGAGTGTHFYTFEQLAMAGALYVLGGAVRRGTREEAMNFASSPRFKRRLREALTGRSRLYLVVLPEGGLEFPRVLEEERWKELTFDLGHFAQKLQAALEAEDGHVTA